MQDIKKKSIQNQSQIHSSSSSDSSATISEPIGRKRKIIRTSDISNNNQIAKKTNIESIKCKTKEIIKEKPIQKAKYVYKEHREDRERDRERERERDRERERERERERDLIRDRDNDRDRSRPKLDKLSKQSSKIVDLKMIDTNKAKAVAALVGGLPPTPSILKSPKTEVTGNKTSIKEKSNIVKVNTNNKYHDDDKRRHKRKRHRDDSSESSYSSQSDYTSSSNTDSESESYTTDDDQTQNIKIEEKKQDKQQQQQHEKKEVVVVADPKWKGRNKNGISMISEYLNVESDLLGKELSEYIHYDEIEKDRESLILEKSYQSVMKGTDYDDSVERYYLILNSGHFV